MTYVVNKFGGDLSADSVNLEKSISLIRRQMQAGYKPIIVISAIRGITDQLHGNYNYALGLASGLQNRGRPRDSNILDEYLETALEGIKGKHYKLVDVLISDGKYRSFAKQKIDSAVSDVRRNIVDIFENGDPTGRLHDRIGHYGEVMAASILFNKLLEDGVKVELIDPQDTSVITDGNFGTARIDMDLTREQASKYKPLLDSGYVILEPGYFGIKDGEITLMGRGASDSKSIGLAIALDAEVYLWKTTVLMSADPQVVPQARHVPKLDYGEAVEAGKVIQSEAVALASDNNKPIVIKSIDRPKATTTIVDSVGDPEIPVKIISSSSTEHILDIRSPMMDYAGTFPYHLFAERGVNISTIDSNMRGRALVTCRGNGNHNTSGIIEDICDDIRRMGYEVDHGNVALVYVIGRGSSGFGVVEKINRLAERYAVVGASPTKKGIPAVVVKVEPKHAEMVVKKLHKELIETA